MADETEGTLRIEVPLVGLEKAEDALHGLALKAKKKNLPAVSWEVISADITTGIVEIDVSTTPIRFDGWGVHAVLDWSLDSGEALSRSMPGMEELNPVPSACVCEHCGTRRDRNRTFVLKRDDGESRQVGTNCVEDFMGHDDPALVAQMAAQAVLWGEIDDRPFAEPDGGYGGFVPTPVPTRDYMATVAMLTEAEGFVSQAAAENQISKGDDVSPPTWMWAKDLICKRTRITPTSLGEAQRDAWKTWGLNEPPPHHPRHLGEADRWLKVIQEIPGDTEWMRNLRLLASDPVARPDHMPRLAAIASTVMRHERESFKQEFVGTIGKRESFEATLERKIPMSGWSRNSPPSVLCIFRDTEGRKLTWLTGQRPSVPSTVGATYRMVGSVKEHRANPSDGSHETRLIRVKASMIERNAPDMEPKTEDHGLAR